jgi:hypothetical protein
MAGGVLCSALVASSTHKANACFIAPTGDETPLKEVVRQATGIVLATVKNVEDVSVPLNKVDGSPAGFMMQIQYTFSVGEILQGHVPTEITMDEELRNPGTPAPPPVDDQDFVHHRAVGWKKIGRVPWHFLGPGDCGLHPQFKAGAQYLLFQGPQYKLGFEQIIYNDDAWLREVRRAIRSKGN